MTSTPDPIGPRPPSPWKIITDTVTKVPAAKFLLVLVGIVAVGALAVLLFAGNWKMALVATCMSFLFSVPAILLMSVVRVTPSPAFRYPIYAMLWAFLLLATCVFVLLITTTVIPWPRDIKVILGEAPKDQPAVSLEWDLDKYQNELATKPYVILSATDYIHIDPVPNTTDLVCNRRIVYDVLPLRDITPQDKDHFIEQYSTIFGNAFPPQHWFGTDEERIFGTESKPEGRPYDVNFSAKKFSPRSITTGCNAVYHNVDEVRHPPFAWPTNLQRGDDWFAYPNHDDYIGQYTIIIDSNSLDLKLLQAIGERPPNLQLQAAGVNSNVGKNVGQHGISARWENLIPGDNVEIVFHYDPHG